MSSILTFGFYLFVILFISSYMNKKILRERFGVVIVGCSAFCAVIMAYKGTLGTDTNMYISVYENGISSLHRWVDFEYGFQILLNLFRYLHMPYQLFFFTINFVTMLFIFMTINHEKNNINVYVTTFLFIINFYFLSWNIIRQTLAMAIAIYAMCVYLDGKRFLGLTLILLAGLFHTSAYICFIVLFGEYVFKNKKYKYFLAVAAILAVFLVVRRDILGDIVYSLTHEYYYASYFTRNAETDGNLLTFYLKQSPILLVSVVGWKNYEMSPKYRVLFSFMIIGYIFSSIGSVTATQIQRIGYYFTYFNPLILGMCCNNKLKIARGIVLSKRDVTLLILISMITLFWFDRFFKGYANLVPYPIFKLFD